MLALDSTDVRNWWAICLLALSVFLLTSAAGCSGGMKVSESAYRGPPIGVDDSGDFIEVVAVLPSPGWRVTLDSHDETPDAVRLFVSLRRPNPAAVYPQREVSQRVLTPIRSGERVVVYVRRLSFSGDEDSDAPYFRVLE